MEKLLLDGVIPVNCYFIIEGKDCYIVDPGFQKERVVKFIDEHNLNVLGILLTHGHIDHIGAIDAFDVPVYLHEDELEILEDNYLNGFEYYGQEKPYVLSELNIKTFKAGDKLPLGSQLVEVIHTPGHTVGSVCLKHGMEIYTGDTLFKGTVGRWEFPTGDQTVLRKSIIAFIEGMDEEVVLHPAHGESTTIGNEKRSNPFYHYWKKHGLIEK